MKIRLILDMEAEVGDDNNPFDNKEEVRKKVNKNFAEIGTLRIKNGDYLHFNKENSSVTVYLTIDPKDML